MSQPLDDVDARLVGPLSIDLYRDTHEELPGGGALNMAYHWAQFGMRCELVSRIAHNGAELFEAFVNRHHIDRTPHLVQPGVACTVDIRFAADRQPTMDNFIEGVLGDFRLTTDEADRVCSGRPAHLVLVDVIDDELHQVSRQRSLDDARLTGDFLSFGHFTPQRFAATMRFLDIGFIGWPGPPDDDLVTNLVALTVNAGKVLVITFGSNGVRVVDARHSTVEDRWFEVVAVPVTGTTLGCGDSFIAAFLATWYRTGDLAESVEAGCVLGATATAWSRALPDQAYR
ncbi:MAG: sugar/nucleoside kinase (ribokinase family) [Ilumatobacter sp.]|jgi:sugar/nucleoside kinase (ribokinase family)